MFISDIALGICLLFVGRKLFWLAVGILGFVVGMQYAAVILPQADGVMILLAAIFFGLVGAVLAVTFEWIAILFIGFLGGGYFLTNVALLLTTDAQVANWSFFMGGIVGVIVMTLSFDIALIVISSLVGAVLVTKHLVLDEMWSFFVFVGCLILGVAMQYFSLERPRSGHREVMT